MKPHDIIVLNGRTWEVTGQYLGGVQQESVVGLRTRDVMDPTAHGESIDEMFVPLTILEAACRQGVLKHYTLVESEAAHG